MNNNHASNILGQIERIEKRMTSMQGRGLDISALASQVIVAREMLNDGRYDDASIFCQEILDLADRIAGDKGASDQGPESIPPAEAVRQEDTKRFSKSSSSLNQQIKDAVDVGMLGRLRGQLSEQGLLDSTALHSMRDAITKRVAEEVCSGLQQQLPQADTSIIDQAFSYVMADKKPEHVDDPVCIAVSDLIAKTMDHSFKLYEQQLKMLLDQLSIEQKKINMHEEDEDEDVMSVQVVRTDQEIQRVAESDMNDDSKPQDDESFAGLPRIPRHGESLDDDSTFRAVTIDPTLSSSVFQSETETANQAPAIAAEIQEESGSESYEPVTGSMLRPNTSVFTESNAMKSESSAVPVAAEIAEQAEPSRVDTMNKEEIKVLLREMLPSLLEDEEIKQALFASLAIEMVTKPSVLGSLSGLRAFIQQELDAAQSGMVG